MRNAEVIRQWKILKTVEVGRFTSSAKLAAAHGVTERTIRRDIEALQEAGFPLYDDRANGKKVGLIKLRFFRPFPAAELIEATKDLKALGVYDRAISFGSGGPSWIETRHALYGHTDIPVTCFLAGLGGRDVTPESVATMFDNLLDLANGRIEPHVGWIGTRGVEP